MIAPLNGGPAIFDARLPMALTLWIRCGTSARPRQPVDRLSHPRVDADGAYRLWGKADV